jgi:hypothetical protein
MFEEETPVAWQAVPREAVVVAGDGTEIGRTESLLGDEEEDIFHGIAMRRAADGETVEVPAARVKRMTEHHVVTDLGADEVSSLRAYPAG